MVHNRNTLVSICSLSFNHEKYIDQTINGFLMQKTNFDFEIIIHDDASTDATQDIIKRHQKKHPEIIKPIFQTKNQYSKGIKPIFEYVFPKVQSKYIALCEGDDYWTDPLKLQKQVDFLEENEEYSLCFTRFKTKNEVSELIEDDKNGHYFNDAGNNIEFNFEKFYKGWHIGTQTVVFKNFSEIIESLTRYKIPRDVHLYTELLKHGRGACLADFCAVYRLTGKGVHTSISKKNQVRTGAMVYEDIFKQNKDIYMLELKYRRFFKKYLRQLASDRKVFSYIKNSILSFHITNKISYLKQDMTFLMRKINDKF